MQTSSPMRSFNWQHGAVLLIGLLVFVLLLFADKTSLNDDKAENLGGRAGDTSGQSSEGLSPDRSSLLALIPPANPSEEMAALLTALGQEENAGERVDLLQRLVAGFRQQGRWDVAAIYAGDLAREKPEVRNLIVAGALFRNATKLPEIAADTSVFRKFSDEALRFLKSATELEPRNEDALLEYGLAMVESQKGNMGMQGIFKIREVTEINPQNAEALFHLGKFSMETAQYDKAEQRFRQVLAIDSLSYSSKFYLGLAVQQLGNTAEFQALMSEVAMQQVDLSLAAEAKKALNSN